MTDDIDERLQALSNFLRQEEQGALDTSLDQARATALGFYRGEKFGNEEEGRSQVVTRDVAEVIDYQVVAILGTILAGGKVVSFETDESEVAGDNGEPVAKDFGQEATEAVQYLFMRKQPGYRILHDSLKAGLLERSGVVKTVVDMPTKRETIQVPAGFLDEIDSAAIVSARGLDEGWEEGLPAGMWEIEVETPLPPVFRDEAVPNEEFRVSPDARDLDSAVYVAHLTPKTLSELRQMGFDADDLEDMWGSLAPESVAERARDAGRSTTQRSIGSRTGPDRTVWLAEEYPLWDYDDDGIAERLCVHRVGSHILRRRGEPSITTVAEQPFSLWSPFPMSHRLIGDSSADKTMDIQAIRSTLLRQGLDSLYLTNAPRMLVDETGVTEDTYDDLLTVTPGALVRYKGGAAPQPLQMADASPQAFQAMEMMTGERESRTGVTRQNKGLNPDSLRTDTASGMAMMLSQGDQIQLYLARNFAEMLVAPMFAKRYRLMREYGQPFRMKIDGTHVDIDPRAWPEDIDVQINVGLGTGNKDARLQHRMALLGIQQQAMMAGLPIVGAKQVYNSVKGLIEDSALGVPTDFVLDPDQLPPQEPKPDPETVKAQAAEQTKQMQVQADMLKAQGDHELKQRQLSADAELKARAQDYDLQAKREAAALDSELKRDRAVEEARLAQERFEFESALALRRMDFEQSLARERLASAADGEGGDLSTLRPGGALDE